MRNLKKILALVLALMMVLSTMAVASATTFADDADINAKYAEAVSVLSGIGVIRGVENADGTFNFNPKGALNRAQAATIISYVLEGTLDTIADQVSIYENPFTDVPTWAEPYVLYAHSNEIIVGRNATTFDPNATITGYELGKMLLIAGDICTAGDFMIEVYIVDGKAYTTEREALVAALNAGGVEYTTKSVARSDWQVVVASALKDAGIWNSEFKLSKKLTREEACYLAFNTVIATDLDTNVFELDHKPAVDEFGRTTKVWFSTREDLNKMEIALADHVAPIVTVATKAVTADATGINTLLGLKDKAALAGTPAVYVNGAEDASGINIGDTVEVYAAEGEISKIVIVREALATVTVAAKAEEGDENPYKGLYKYTFSTGAITYAAKDAYNTKATYLVVNDGEELLNVANPTVISNAKITKADKATVADATYVYVNDQKLVKATVNTVLAGADFGKAYDYVLNTNGYLVAIEEAKTVEVEVELETGYAYLLGAEKQITNTETTGSLIGGDGSYAWSVAAVAKLALADGTVAIVNLNTVVEKDDDGKTTALTLNGVEMDSIAGDAKPQSLIDDLGLLEKGWVAYEIQEDGTYIIANIADSLTTVKLAEETALVSELSLYATSATVWYDYSFNTATKTVTVTENVGYNSFDDKNHDVLYAVNEKVHASIITTIVSFGSETPNTDTTVYEAYFVGGGEFTMGKQAVGFFHDGAYTEYFYADSHTGTPEVGGVYNLTLDAKGNITKVAQGSNMATKTGKVEFVDEEFVIIDGVMYTHYYFECYNISEGHTGEVDTLEVGDTVALYYSTKYASISTAFILVEAE